MGIDKIIMNIIFGVHPGFSPDAYTEHLLPRMEREPETYFIHFPMDPEIANYGFNRFYKTVPRKIQQRLFGLRLSKKSEESYLYFNSYLESLNHHLKYIKEKHPNEQINIILLGATADSCVKRFSPKILKAVKSHFGEDSILEARSELDLVIGRKKRAVEDDKLMRPKSRRTYRF
ncbi:MAG TPA: hypothetical protein VFF13_06790 [archaeon]|nr:hypothetical protein [archaeon]